MSHDTFNLHKIYHFSIGSTHDQHDGVCTNEMKIYVRQAKVLIGKDFVIEKMTGYDNC